MNSIPILFGVLITVFVAHHGSTGPVPAQKQQADGEQLRGVWKVVSAKYRFQETEKLFLTYFIKFDADSVNMYRAGPNGKIGEVSYITLDAKKVPKQIDMFGKRNKSDKPLLGIYAIEKDQLKLSWSMNDGRDRPASFEVDRADKKTRHISLILERVKEKT